MKFKPGDRVKFYKTYQDYDDVGSPLWGGKHGKVVGTILENNDREFIERYGRPEYNRICIKWDNGKLNGYSPEHWEDNFQLVHEERQLKLFGGD